MKDHVRIVLIGDEGVGKSSLISSYISKHFPVEVPDVLTECIIPPALTSDQVRVTLIDTSTKPGDEEVLRHKIAIADSIIALYDVTRPETLSSLFIKWLPLVQEICETKVTTSSTNNTNTASSGPVLQQHDLIKPVVVVGTKIDLQDEEEDTMHKLHSLLTQFKFVIFSYRCSAAKLQDVDQIFFASETSVTCPLSPLYDMNTGTFTPKCRKAFIRIFRIFDVDGDNLLSDIEYCEINVRCFLLPIYTEELISIKKMISNINGGLIHDMVTFEGFLFIIEKYITTNNPRIPWIILRAFDFDDDLKLMIPDEILEQSRMKPHQISQLSTDAHNFLLHVAENCRSDRNSAPILGSLSFHFVFDDTNLRWIEQVVLSVKPSARENDAVIVPDPFSEMSGDISVDSSRNSSSQSEGYLSWETLQSILCVLDDELSSSDCSPCPWLTPPYYESKWHLLDEEGERDQNMLLMCYPHNLSNLSIDSWLTQWNVMALNNPILTQEILFRLGYVDREDLGISVASNTISWMASKKSKKFPWKEYFLKWMPRYFRSPSHEPLKRSVINVSVFGDNSVGKSSFVWIISGLRAPGDPELERGTDYLKYEDTVVTGGFSSAFYHPAGNVLQSNGNTFLVKDHNYLTDPYYVSVSAVPMDHEDDWIASKISSMDVAILMFECGNMKSVDTLFRIEAKLPQTLPRMYIASKTDLLPTGLNTSRMDTDRESKLYISTLSEVSNSADITIDSSSSYALPTAMECDLVFQRVNLHIQERNLPQLRMISSAKGDGVDDVKNALLDTIEQPVKAIPTFESDTGKYPNYLINTSIVAGTFISGLVGAYVYYYYYDQIGYWNQLIHTYLKNSFLGISTTIMKFSEDYLILFFPKWKLKKNQT